MRDYHFGEGGDDFAESGEALVDVGSLLQAGPFRSRRVGPLRASKIHERDLAHLLRRQVRRLIEAPLREDDGEHGVRSARRFVHVRRCHRPFFRKHTQNFSFI